MGYLDELFGLHGKTAVVTGGAGAIVTLMSGALLNAGDNVCMNKDLLQSQLETLEIPSGVSP